MNDHVLIYGNVDENGEFTEVILGERILPSKQYDYFFYVHDLGVLEDIGNYKVNLKTRELVLK